MTISKYRKVKELVDTYASECKRDRASIRLVVVSKGRPISEILELYEEGVRDFGESRVQEALEKERTCPERYTVASDWQRADEKGAKNYWTLSSYTLGG